MVNAAIFATEPSGRQSTASVVGTSPSVRFAGIFREAIAKAQSLALMACLQFGRCQSDKRGPAAATGEGPRLSVQVI